jgi:antitoxin CptB
LNELKKKILWQCRRGLWELDAIFIPFVENNFDYLEEDEISNFQRLLEYEDIEIFDILVNKKSLEDVTLQPIIKKIINFHDVNLGNSS